MKQGTQRLILRIVPVSLVTGVKAQMEKFDFLFGLCLGDCILRHTDNLSKTLQSPSLSAADNQQLAQLICNTLDCLRNQELFSLLWDKVSGMQEKLQIDQAMLPRRHDGLRWEMAKGLSQRLSKTTFGPSIMLLLMQPWHVLDSG